MCFLLNLGSTLLPFARRMVELIEPCRQMGLPEIEASPICFVFLQGFVGLWLALVGSYARGTLIFLNGYPIGGGFKSLFQPKVI